MASTHVFLAIFVIFQIASLQASPIKCDDRDIPNSEKNELCWLGVYLPRQPNLPVPLEAYPNVDFLEVQRRNAELSSALNYLYSKEGRFPGKRNPELSTALLNYLSRNKQY